MRSGSKAFTRFPAPLEQVKAYVGANSRKAKSAGNPLVGKLIRLLIRCVQALSWEQAFALGGYLGAAMAAMGIRRQVAAANLDIVYKGRLNAAEKRRIYKASWVNFGRVVINHMRLPYQPPDFWAAHVRFPQEQTLQALYGRGRGVIMVCGHLGMMDLSGGRLGQCGYPVAVVAKPMRSPSIDTLVVTARSAMNLSTISHRNSARRILKGLRNGEAVVFIADQNMKRSQGIFVDWFGQPASVSPAAAVFARQTKAPVVVGYLEQTGPKQFVMHMSAPLPWISLADDPDAELVANTQNQAKAYQRMISEKPELWFWIHRRWKIQPDGKKWPYPKWRVGRVCL
jgi:Kdo2-lipid IVA lauroyltransferase/acyltransferase